MRKKIATPEPINDSPPISRRTTVWSKLRRQNRQQLEDGLAAAEARGDAANCIVYAKLIDELNENIYGLIAGKGRR